MATQTSAAPRHRPAPAEGRRIPPRPPLRRRECLLACVVFGLWIGLFASGALLDTRIFLHALHLDRGVALVADASTVPARFGWMDALPAWQAVLACWALVFVSFLPLNLALICVSAGALGVFGNRAHLGNDDDDAPVDSTNPYLSALLRGFFMYLFLISGMLMLDDTPFVTTSADQYIRLAGFVSIFSFVVNHDPEIFTTLVAVALRRLRARTDEHRDGDGRDGTPPEERVPAAHPGGDGTAGYAPALADARRPRRIRRLPSRRGNGRPVR